MTNSITPLTLGIDIEEVYETFGEGLILFHMGLQAAQYEQGERQAQRVRDGMLDLGCPMDLVRRFEAAASRINRSGDSLPDGLSPDQYSLMVSATATDLSILMGDVRGHLPSPNAELYDLGVMLARLSLCLRFVTTAVHDDELVEYHRIYLQELARVVPILTGMIQTVRELPAFNELLPHEPLQGLSQLASHLTRWDGGSDGWSQAAHAYTERFLRSIGMALGQPVSPQPETKQTPLGTEDLKDQLRELRQRVYQLYLAGDFANAEKGQRLLIDDCRRTIGPWHEMTLGVRNDLALTLLSQGRGDVAADRAYDVADETERVLGGRHAATAREQVRTLYVLMATKDFEECARFYQSKLLWLAKADPRELDPPLRQTRQELVRLVGGDSEKESGE